MDNTKIKTILLIDDVPQNLKVLGNTLKEVGYKVIIAANGQTGIHAAKTQKINLILLDIQMPEMDGYDVCRELKSDEITKEIPVIFLTASHETEALVKGFELGGMDYITKPFDKKEVLVRIHNHLMIRDLQLELKEKNDILQKLLDREREVSQIKTNLISLASHDLRSPLAVISSSNQMLGGYGDQLSGKAKQNHHHNIDISVQNIEKMLDNILMYSKVESSKVVLNVQSMYAKEFCTKLLAELRIISYTHTIKLSIEENGLEIKADPILFQHIFLNLLSNAIKYSPEQSTIIWSITKQNGKVIFGIKDEGIGIPEDEIPKLFTEFHRARNVKDIKGTGLGLFIVKQFVELHGGSIEVKSELWKGSEFIVSIPA
ncbi:MAG: hybrid sensor histidine kinase/response regulator [Leptospiraceae bacterium]|nr:hybrid sensor histidine kinase/response regulator [Leptospiraceae bacterium]